MAGQWDDDPELEYVFVSRCPRPGQTCDDYSIVQLKQTSVSSWKSIALIPAAGNPEFPTRSATVEAVLKGQLAFTTPQYHCMTIKEQKACDGFGKHLY